MENSMFITFDKHNVYIRGANGLIKTVKSIPEEILDAVLQGNTIRISTKKGILIYKQIGKSYSFSFYRRY